jgi:hypothetical protein
VRKALKCSGDTASDGIDDDRSEDDVAGGVRGRNNNTPCEGPLRKDLLGEREPERIKTQDGKDRQRRHFDTDTAGEKCLSTVSFQGSVASRYTDG